jgi:hypothetical protein
MKSNRSLSENIPAPETAVPFGNFQGNGSEPPPDRSRRKTAAQVFADMAKLRAAEEAPLIDTVEHLVNVAVRRPKSGEFFRTHPDPEMSLRIAVYENRDEQLVYFVEPEIRPLLGEQLRAAMLVTCINQAGVIFLWPVKMAESNRGGGRSWSESAMRAAILAKDKWVRLIGEIGNGAYRVFSARGELPEPTWPDRSLQEYLVVAFEGRIIDDPEHDVIRRLQGLK